MRCKDCEFFSTKPRWRGDHLFENWGSCNNEGIFQDASNVTLEPTEKTLFRFMDSEEYEASFQVHENFGCVGFKKRGYEEKI